MPTRRTYVSEYLRVRGDSQACFEANKCLKKKSLPSLLSSLRVLPDSNSEDDITHYPSSARILRCALLQQQSHSISPPDMTCPESNQEVPNPIKLPTDGALSRLPSLREVLEIPYTPNQKRPSPWLEPIYRVSGYRRPPKRCAIQSNSPQDEDSVIQETPFARSDNLRYSVRDGERQSPDKGPIKSIISGKFRNVPDQAHRSPNPQPSTRTPPYSVVFCESHGYTYESLEVQAPEPPVGDLLITPEELVSPPLAKLAEDLSIPKRFRTETISREIRPFERGFWLLDCSGWDDRLRREGWAFLTNYVGNGAAGWGVRSLRDGGFQWIRVYCWGHIVPHIYLLLYLVSQRDILFTGSSWFDGAGEQVVITGKRPRG
ncbi:hypothetical protein F5X99DRAFT_428119 [Biscogniauxia marginata]|nr:hypothetical protein F5X99DRAFT_428119 [Biscogniauxia marginata]